MAHKYICDRCGAEAPAEWAVWAPTQTFLGHVCAACLKQVQDFMREHGERPPLPRKADLKKRMGEWLS